MTVRAHARSSIVWALLHHMLAAATIATSLLLAEAWHQLDWLDAVMLRVVAPAAMGSNVVGPLPAVVLIDDESYARDFKLRSPLEREPLQRLISKIVETKPQLLVIDLQIEPASGETSMRPLDEVLLAARASGTRIVLPLPERRSRELAFLALDWVRRMCAGGVVFGSAYQRDHFGVVVRYDADPLALAMVAHAQLQATRAPRSVEPVVVACDLPEHLSRTEQALEILVPLEHAVSHSETRLLSPAVLARLGNDTLVSNADLGAQLRARQSGGVVVLGGSYDARDRFVTVGGIHPGPVVHAAALAGHNRIHAADHVLAWILDVIIGVILGFVFTWAWRIHAVLERRMKEAHEVDSRGVRWSGVRAFYVWLMWGGVVWLSPVVLALVSVVGSGALMQLGWWLNPGPVIAGMFLHAMLLQHSHDHPHPTRWREFVRQHPAAVLAQLPFIVGGLTLALWRLH